MAGRRIRDATEARACLSAARTSGMERSEWAREHGIDGRSLNAWRLNLERAHLPGRSGAGVRLVELVAASSPSQYVIRFGGFAVEVDEDFDDATLHRLLRVVSAC